MNHDEFAWTAGRTGANRSIFKQTHISVPLTSIVPVGVMIHAVHSCLYKYNNNNNILYMQNVKRHSCNMYNFGVCGHQSGLVFLHSPHCFSLMRRTGASHRMSCPLQFPSPMKRKGAPPRLSAWKSPLQPQTPPR